MNVVLEGAHLPAWFTDALHAAANAPEFLAHIVNMLQDLLSGNITEDAARAELEGLLIGEAVALIERQVEAHAPAFVAGAVRFALDNSISRGLMTQAVDAALKPVFHALLVAKTGLLATLGTLKDRVKAAGR